MLLEHDGVAVLAASCRVYIFDIRDGECEVVCQPCRPLIRVQNRVHVALGAIDAGQDHRLLGGFVIGEVLCGV